MWFLPFAGAAAALGSSAAGLAMSAVKDSAIQKKQYRYNLELQREAQRWQEYMSSTAHQRQVNDLRKAGLNPILSATGGSGAPFSNASGGSVSAPSSSASGGLLEGVNAASQLAQTAANVKAVESQAKLNEQTIDTQLSQQLLNDAKAEEARARADEIAAGLPFERHITSSAKSFQKAAEDVIKEPKRYLPPLLKGSPVKPSISAAERKWQKEQRISLKKKMGSNAKQNSTSGFTVSPKDVLSPTSLYNRFKKGDLFK